MNKDDGKSDEARREVDQRGKNGKVAKSNKNEPVNLDQWRSEINLIETETRRDLLADIRSDQAAQRRRLEEFEANLFATSATTWPEATAKVEYLLQLLAATPHASAPDRQEMIASVLDDLARLTREDTD